MKYLHPDILDGGLLAIKNTAVKMLLIKSYAFGDSYAAVNAAKLAEVNTTSTDFIITSSGNNRVLTTASGKSATASANSTQYESSTATGGTTTTLADTTKTWTTNAHAGRAVRITAGAGAGQYGRIVSNTATGLTLQTAWAIAPNGTSVYKIVDDLHFAFTDGSGRVLWVENENSDQTVTSGNTIDFPSMVTTAFQPAAV